MPGFAHNYGNVKDQLQDPDPVVRRNIAASTEIAAEILYFLINDVDATVRRAVAANPNTPRQADTILAKDTDLGVRCELARKIVGTGLDDDERSELWRMGFTILETLATDSIVRVRKSLAEALKSWLLAPHAIVTQLARDSEPEVAVPVIEHSKVLTDDDLVDFISVDAPKWTVEAASHRAEIGPRLAEAIAANGQVAPVTDLLKNNQAEISKDIIDDLAKRAEKVKEWREPLVQRPNLSSNAILSLARFVSTPLMSILKKRGGLKSATAAKLGEIAESRFIAETNTVSTTTENKPAGDWGGSDDRALRLFQSGKLNDAAVELALDSRDGPFVIASLALRSQTAQSIVQRVVDAKSAKLITAICWKGNFSMRFALDIQKRLAQIQPDKLLYARNGFDFPHTELEMNRQLEIITN